MTPNGWPYFLRFLSPARFLAALLADSLNWT